MRGIGRDDDIDCRMTMRDAAIASDAPWRRRLSDRLNRFVRVQVRIGQRSVSAFHLCGFIGLAFAWPLALTLVWHRGLPLWPMAVVAVAAMATFFVLAMATKIITGEETLIYYHHEIAIITVAALILWLLDRPVLAYLDPTILGVGAFLACGRIGCLMVGCCHGRPARWGVRYRTEHVARGFPSCYAGVSLIPVQAIESLWVVTTVVVGAGMVFAGREPGVAFAWYVVIYDLGRFLLEFVRGDAERPYRRGLSTPQWLAVVLTALVALGEIAGSLPFRTWHVVAAIGLAIVAAIIVLRRRSGRDPRYLLLHPRHAQEMASTLAALREGGAASEVVVRETSLGLLMSGGAAVTGTGQERYALSLRGGTLNLPTATALGQLIGTIRGAESAVAVTAGQHDVMHVRVETSGE